MKKLHKKYITIGTELTSIAAQMLEISLTSNPSERLVIAERTYTSAITTEYFGKMTLSDVKTELEKIISNPFRQGELKEKAKRLVASYNLTFGFFDINLRGIEEQLHVLRLQICNKIIKIIETCPEQRLHLDDEKMGDNTYVFYSDDDGDAYEGRVTSVWLEGGMINFKVYNFENPVDINENEMLYATRSHEWLINILVNMCETLNIDLDTL